MTRTKKPVGRSDILGNGLEEPLRRQLVKRTQQL